MVIMVLDGVAIWVMYKILVYTMFPGLSARGYSQETPYGVFAPENSARESPKDFPVNSRRCNLRYVTHS
jgi:hypothetical protein